MQTEILVVLRVAAFRADSSNNREWNVQVGTGTIKASTHRERAGLLRAHQPAITARKSLQDDCAAALRHANTACVGSVAASVPAQHWRQWWRIKAGSDRSKVTAFKPHRTVRSGTQPNTPDSFKHELLWTSLYFSSLGFSHELLIHYFQSMLAY